jgi:endonuclease/exonuclease/phosphatase family metal-dependent hydrolase
VKPFRILQFNMQFGQIWHAHDPDHAPIRLDDTIAEIRSHEADIIHLQEVEHARSDAHQNAENFERLRAALPGYHAHFAFPRPDPRELPFGIGLAIFSRTPLTATFAEDLPSPPIEFNFSGETKTPTDRLLIGARTTSTLRRLLGSTASQVVAEAPCTVTVVRAPLNSGTVEVAADSEAARADSP